MNPSPAEPVARELVEQLAAELVPHHKAIGTHLVACEPGEITLGIRWREDLVGDPESGAIMGAVIASVLDHAAGLAVLTRFGMRAVGAAATLDMRVDYLALSTRGQTVHVRADCHTVTDELAFVRGEAFHPDARPAVLATASIAYMVAGASVRSGIKP
jgi:acyl-coenzyme A thioesterase PaaI-like protein